MNSMKNTIRTILCAAAFAALAVSCQKEIEQVKPVAGVKETIEISVNGLMGEYTQVDATKSELVNSVRVAWEGGETVYVYDETKYLGSLTASLDESKDDRYALLSGSVNEPAGNTLFLVHSPILEAAPAIDGGKLSVSLAEQSTTKAPFLVYATLEYDGVAVTDVIAPFNFATSVIRVSCTGLTPNTAISSAEISNVNTSCVLTFANGDVTASGADEGTIVRSTADGFAKVNAEGDAGFQVAVPALSSSTGRTLTIKQGEIGHIDENFSTASINPNYSVNTICTMLDADTITPDSPVGTIGFLRGRKAMVVNLYGTKYAVALMNEGATAESEAGSYGDYYGFEEAATFFHGSDLNVWRVPSMDEMYALADNTREYDSTTPAVKFILAGGSINFPLAGLHSSEDVPAEVGVNGIYYTSTHVEGEEFYYICLMHSGEISADGKPYVGPEANPAADSFKLSLRLFYQLTETNTDALHGRFTVNSEGKQVYFSKGNLQATSEGGLFNWGFAENQYDYFGERNSVTGQIDLFGWSTWRTYYGITTSASDPDYRGDFEDWGTAIDGDIWRTLTSEEWMYLLNTRTVNGGTGYGKTCTWATIKDNEDNEYDGLVIFCDGYQPATETEELEAIPENCVFLPAAGRRIGYEYKTNFVYWSASSGEIGQANLAKSLSFVFDIFNPAQSYAEFTTNSRHYGEAVRLVTDCE